MQLFRTPRSPLVRFQAITPGPSPFSSHDLGIERKAAGEVRPAGGYSRPDGDAVGAGVRGIRDSQWPFATEHDPGLAVR